MREKHSIVPQAIVSSGERCGVIFFSNALCGLYHLETGSTICATSRMIKIGSAVEVPMRYDKKIQLCVVPSVDSGVASCFREWCFW